MDNKNSIKYSELRTSSRQRVKLTYSKSDGVLNILHNSPKRNSNLVKEFNLSNNSSSLIYSHSRKYNPLVSTVASATTAKRINIFHTRKDNPISLSNLNIAKNEYSNVN